jgi:Mycotoxin biosynthesis protein UstYa
MHCLGQLRRFSYMFLDAVVKADPDELHNIKHMFIDMDHAEHMTHCFDYLRQTIQCGGDMAMEWPRTEPDGRRFAVDGWGIPHECKDWVS